VEKQSGEKQIFLHAPGSKRIAAAFIDCGLIPGFIALVISVTCMLTPSSFTNFAVFFATVAWFSLKDTFFDGAGPGKKMLGLRVVNKTTGAKITAGQGFIRSIPFLIPVIAIAGFAVELIMVIKYGERFGDKWAGTQVVSL
jgi:uncharacterized RDD family membrane protein YckC